ncbi:DUF7674 family protein [Chengkuizengella sediminis]|uniref:DUF7674 family protein n=1 Tax=Chengkuizengella sediminis TaxID=1885917 RepID=UPI001389FB15|nr:hypothetical protein [Chengkuizengella sediminis]NDI36668.1 hypothetical protein [Chengkuizengella sediminis]
MNKSNLSEELIMKIPELKPLYDKELDDWEEFPGNHNVFGNVLNPFLVELLEKKNQERLKKRIFQFFEDMALSEDDDVQNVLIVTVLEYLGDSEKCLKEARKLMGNRTLEFSKEVEKWLGRS